VSPPPRCDHTRSACAPSSAPVCSRACAVRKDIGGADKRAVPLVCRQLEGFFTDPADVISAATEFTYRTRVIPAALKCLKQLVRADGRFFSSCSVPPMIL
jgi:hypothetical protein